MTLYVVEYLTISYGRFWIFVVNKNVLFDFNYACLNLINVVSNICYWKYGNVYIFVYINNKLIFTETLKQIKIEKDCRNQIQDSLSCFRIYKLKNQIMEL